jgi:predicted ArsR family transcriptional regulator
MDDSDGPGRPPEVTDDEILEIFISSTDPVLTATEVANSLSVGRRGILTRLENLETQGLLRSKDVGARSTVWWYPGHTATKPVD